MSFLAFVGRQTVKMPAKEGRRVRRALIARSFTRFLARRPMFTAPYGKVPAVVGADGFCRVGNAYDDQLDRLDQWWADLRAKVAGWDERRASSTTYRNPRKAAIKASALRRFNERRAS